MFGNDLRGLGAELRRLWAADRVILHMMRGERSGWADEAVEAACGAAGAVVQRISAIGATDLEGLQAKALAVSWCHGGAPVRFGPTTDEVLAAGIVRDLLRMH